MMAWLERAAENAGPWLGLAFILASMTVVIMVAVVAFL